MSGASGAFQIPQEVFKMPDDNDWRAAEIEFDALDRQVLMSKEYAVIAVVVLGAAAGVFGLVLWVY